MISIKPSTASARAADLVGHMRSRQLALPIPRGISLGQHVFPGARARSVRNMLVRSVLRSAQSSASLVCLAVGLAFLDLLRAASNNTFLKHHLALFSKLSVLVSVDV